MKILFLHGWTSVIGGRKPIFLKDAGHDVLNPALDDDDFEAAVHTAQSEYDQDKPDVIVGSSRGGAVAMNIGSGDTPLVLLCPAWKNWGTATTIKPNSVILHSRQDDVIPFADSEQLVANSGLLPEMVTEVGNDHRLADSEPLKAMLEACLAIRPRVIGCDFGVPKRAGDQAKKVIVVEAIRLGKRHYAIEPTGRNTRLVRDLQGAASWKERRRGWTIPDLVESLSADSSVRVAAFDFPFSLPISLLDDVDFARKVGQVRFGTRDAWVEFVSGRLHLGFYDNTAKAELKDLATFDAWRDKRFWLRRATDDATNGSPPLKHKFQNVFAMTLAGNAMLHRLRSSGYTTMLDSVVLKNTPCVIETYPREVAKRIRFSASYKAASNECLTRAEKFLEEQGIKIEFDEDVRHFCEAYRTAGSDPDGADAFLCLVAAIACSEEMAEMCNGHAPKTVLREEGAIVVPKLRLP